MPLKLHVHLMKSNCVSVCPLIYSNNVNQMNHKIGFNLAVLLRNSVLSKTTNSCGDFFKRYKNTQLICLIPFTTVMKHIKFISKVTPFKFKTPIFLA